MAIDVIMCDKLTQTDHTKCYKQWITFVIIFIATTLIPTRTVAVQYINW